MKRISQVWNRMTFLMCNNHPAAAAAAPYCSTRRLDFEIFWSDYIRRAISCVDDVYQATSNELFLYLLYIVYSWHVSLQKLSDD